MKYLSLLIILTFTNAFALEAHVHGQAELSIGFDGAQGKVELTAPSESLFGFEHVAKSAAEKKTVEDVFNKFEMKMSEIVRFDPSLSCQFSKEKMEIISSGKHHSNAVIAMSVRCNKSPVGTEIQFNAKAYFPKLKTINTQVIADSVQKSVKIKSGSTSLILK